MIEKEHLNKLFSNRTKNHEAIRLALWEIAQSVCGKKNSEYASLVWMALDLAIGKIDKKNPDIFSYFWTVGVNSLNYELRKLKEGTVDSDEDEEDTNNLKYIRTADLTPQKSRQLKTSNAARKPDPRKTIQQVIKKLKATLKDIDPEHDEYGCGIFALDLMQEVYSCIWG